MHKLYIYRAKPNPVGKLATLDLPRPEQLLAEWVDLQNITTQPVPIRGLWLAHHEYTEDGVPKAEYTSYWQANYSDELHPGQILRVYAGRLADWKLIRPEDREGVEFHAFADRDRFILNTPHPDTITLWSKNPKNEWVFEDRADYPAAVPEGTVLSRSGKKLVVSVADTLRAINQQPDRLNPPD